MAIAINVGIGGIAKAFNLPLYLDSVGTIFATLLLGWRAGAITGILGFVITSIFINPFAIYFCGTQVAIAVFTHFAAKLGMFSNLFKTVISGVALGVVAAVVSAPVIVLVFGGATGNGAALVTSFFVSTGKKIVDAVLLSGISIEPIDKTLQCITAWFLLKSIPSNLLGKFNHNYLAKNKF